MALILDGTTGISTTGNILGNNITVSGTLSVASFNPAALSVAGNISGANLNISSNAVISGDLTVLGNASLSGNIVGDRIVNGTTEVAIQTTNGNANITVGGVSNVAVFTSTGVLVTGLASASGNITGGNLLSSGLISAAGTITGTTITGSTLSSTGNVNTVGIVASGNASVTDTIFSGAISATGNIKGGNINGTTLSSTGNVNTLGIVATGNVSSGNLLTSGLISAAGTITGTTITGSTLSSTGNVNTVGIVGTGNISTTGNISGGNFIGTIATASQPGITTVGTLGSLAVTANITGGNLLTGGLISSTGAITGATITGSTLSSTGNVNTVGIVGTGNISTTGNVTSGNILTAGLISASGTITGTTITGLTLSTAGNVNTNGIVGTGDFSTTGNITGGNILGGANVNATTHTGTTVSVSANVTGGNINTAGVVTATGNLVGGNVNTGGLISATGNITGGNLLTTGLISASGNITGGNVNTNTISGTGTTIKSTGALNLQPTGNIVLTANTVINNVGEPQQAQDAATKNYVDSVAQGLHVHPAANLASTSDLATYTGATVTYNNGTGGVGATLSLVGNTLTTLDGTAIPAASTTRLLIKNQANAVQNGVYNYTSNSLLTRATDMDTDAELAGGDFLFVISGATLADTSWVQTTDIVSVGNTNIVFTQFSGQGTYTAGTGLGLSGTQFFLANTTVTTGSYGSSSAIATFTVNQQGQLTAAGTASINAPASLITGTTLSSNVTTSSLTTVGTLGSLTVTGNTTSGNLLTSGLVSATGNVFGNNAIITTDLYVGSGADSTGFVNPIIIAKDTGATYVQVAAINSASTGSADFAAYGNNGDDTQSWADMGFTGNAFNDTNYTVTGPGDGYFFVQGNTSFGGNMVIATGNVGTTKDIIFATGGFLTGNIKARLFNATGAFSVTGNIQGGNLVTGGLITATGNITGGNILTGGLISATSTITGSTLSSTGNVNTVGIVASGNVSVTGNIFGGNVLGGANVNATTHTGTSVSVSGTVTAATVNAATIGNTGAVVNGATVSVTANITGGNFITPGLLSVNSGNTTGTVIVNAGANTVGNIGSATNYFGNAHVTSLRALYADLAENYSTDAEYEPGTVLSFGGEHEVTISVVASDANVAGVVSTQPATVMNSGIDAVHVATIALIGRVPVKVVGPITKGAMMVSAGNGHAQACASPTIGTVIGKALENFDGESGVIEIAVGKL